MRTPSSFARSAGGRVQPASTEALLTAAVLVALATSAPAQRQFDALGGSALPAEQRFTYAVALGDVDGDGDLDLVTGDGGQNHLYLNDGAGAFADATAARLPVDDDRTAAIALGDVDGDGDLDIVCGNLGGYRYGEQNRLYLNDGSGTYADATASLMPVEHPFVTGAGDPTVDVALGDVDGDGDLDLVFGNSKGIEDRLYLNDGSGRFGDAPAGRLPSVRQRTLAVALGDVDGDGDLDLVVAKYGYGGFGGGDQNRLFLNDGSGFYTDATATQMPADDDETAAVVLGDVDGDGDLDIVFATQGYFYGEQNRLYLNDGTGTFADATAAGMPPDADRSTSVALGDVDLDGDLDIVFGNIDVGSGGVNRLYLNDGTGAFADASAARMPADNDNTRDVALGDVDGDGDVDLVAGNGFTMREQDRLYLNLLRHLDAPLPLRIGQPYALDAYARYGPATLVQPFLATAAASIPVPPFGTFGLDPTQMIAPPPFFVPQPAGTASIGFAIPNIPALIGTPLHAQALLLPQQRLTNVTRDVLGP